MTPQTLQPFNKVRLGGMEADLEGYAYQIEVHEGTPKAVLWYLSMVGHKTAVQAIWAGLVNTPPQSVVLYREEEISTGENSENTAQIDNDGEQSRKAVMLQLAGANRSGGWSYFKTQLNASYAYQGILIPKAAFLNPPQDRSSAGRRSSPSAARAGERASQAEFILLKPPSLPTRNGSAATSASDSRNSADPACLFQQLYFARLNALTRLPLYPGWSETLWQRATGNGEIERLECAGAEVYLCRKPDEEALRQEIADLVRLGKLEC